MIDITAQKPKTSNIRFKFLSGDLDWATYGGTWISKKFNSEDPEGSYYLVRKLENLYEITGEANPSKYACSLIMVALQSTKTDYPEEMQSAVHFASMSYVDGVLVDADGDTVPNPELVEVEALVDYGFYENLYCVYGNNYKELFRACQDKARQLLF